MTPESNPSLGQYLRQERERRGVTIEQVASATKIGVRQLHALEADHYAELPAKPFIRGFVISYSRFIGIDHKEVLARYGGFLEEKVQERPNRESGHSGYAFDKRDGEQQSRTVLGVVMGSFVVLGVFAMAFLKPSLRHRHGSQLDKLRAIRPVVAPSNTVLASAHDAQSAPEPAPSKEPSPAPSIAVAATPTVSAAAAFASTQAVGPASVPAATPAPVAGNLPAPQATPDPTDPLNSGKGLKSKEIKQRLVVNSSERVWIRYRVDDKPIMQFILKKDGILVLRAKNLIVFQVAHPEVVRISHNNEGYHPMEQDKNIAARHNDATLFYPIQLAKKIEDPFPQSKPLSGHFSPVSHLSETMPTSTP